MLLAFLFIIPFILSLISPVAFRLFGSYWPKLVAVCILLLTAIIILLLEQAQSGCPQVLHFKWIPQLGLNVILRADAFGLYMALIITVMGAGIFSYSSGYLDNDPRMGNITGLLLLFMLAMLGMVLADNIVLFFISWELTSILSFILIGSNHQEESARAGAKTALLVTSIGGLALLAAVVLIGLATGHWNLSELPPLHNHPWSMAIFILICLAAFTKSAQWPFCFWLPAAMAAPTPISAYLHSATMVKAGVFLLYRMHPILSGIEAWTPTLVFVSAATMLVVILTIPKMTDLKALLAYSTVGALALMVCMIGIGTPDALTSMIVFLLVHACYKGPLFLVAGSIEHSVNNRDITLLGGLVKKMPYTAFSAGMAGISMIGLPPTLGFVAKEMVLEAGLFYAPWLVALITVLVAAFVMVGCCVVLIPFFGKHKQCVAKAHEISPSMFVPMLLISGLGIILGLTSWQHYFITPTVALLTVNPQDLGFWHDFTLPLALSIIAVLAGFLAFSKRHLVSKWAPCLPSGFLMHDAIWDALIGFARSVTRIVQNGSLTSYLGTIIVVTCVLLFHSWIYVDVPMTPSIIQKISLAQLSASVLIMLSSLFTVFARKRLPAIAGLGSMGMGMTLFFIVSHAPDLALTQFLVEILIIVLLVVAFQHLPDFTGQPINVQTGKIIISILMGGAMTVLTLVTLSTDYGERVSHWYALNSFKEGKGSNVVNVILVDFRALDTLGEITVLGIAALGVGVLMGTLKQNQPKKVKL